jgi:hypothetical protein
VNANYQPEMERQRLVDARLDAIEARLDAIQRGYTVPRIETGGFKYGAVPSIKAES